MMAAGEHRKVGNRPFKAKIIYLAEAEATSYASKPKQVRNRPFKANGAIQRESMRQENIVRSEIRHSKLK